MEEEDEECNPPLMATYKHLLLDGRQQQQRLLGGDIDDEAELRLPVIDLQAILMGACAAAAEAEQCRAAIVRAASEWGFFQVTNHGMPQQLLDDLHRGQVDAFRRPFHRKLLGMDFASPEAYRWGTPTATCLDQLSWSEAYHIPMTKMTIAPGADACSRLVIEEVSSAMFKLALQLVGILIAGLEEDGMEVVRCTRRDTCFLRLNRYPASGGALVLGLCPHTDSDFLTILHQDAVGGLQLLDSKDDGRWVAVRPNPGALIVNVGDLLQAWSNDRYRSVEHRVVAPAAADRFSVAFFLCPAYQHCITPRCVSGDPPRYRSFTFREYRNQVTEDVRLTGRKLGLQRFRLCPATYAAAQQASTGRPIVNIDA